MDLAFGDGGTSTAEAPIHQYTTAGTYTVTMTATNANGSNTATQSGYIVVTKVAAMPVAGFVSSVSSGSEPLAVQFVDSSTNSPVSWAWSFGDGTTSTTENPSHTYTDCGHVHGHPDGHELCRQQHGLKSRLYHGHPGGHNTGGFLLGNQDFRHDPLTVQFIDTSTNSPTSWVWSFGDGYTNLQQNPVHTYTAAGTYTVTLTASNSAGSSTYTQSGYITTTLAAPIASFTSNITYRDGTPVRPVQ